MKWAVVGMGRAGLLRAQALESDVRVAEVIRSSRRSGTVSFEDVLTGDARCVALCRETERHYEDSRRILEARKHLLVEYPMASTASEVACLQARARAYGLVCHVGHLLLMSDWHASVKNWLHHSAISECDYWFVGGFGRSPRRLVQREAWGDLVVPRIHHLWSWFGPLALEQAQVAADAQGFQLDITLRAVSGVPVRLKETRREGTVRHRGVQALDNHGQRLTSPEWIREPGLFQKDTTHAIDVCAEHGVVKPRVSAQDVLDVRKLADTIQHSLLFPNG